MLQPVELRASGGRVLIGPLAMIPPLRRGMQSPLLALARLFQDRGAIAQLRSAWPRLDLGGGHPQQLSAAEMRDALERAIVLHRIILLWIPSVSHHAIHVTVPPKPPMLPRGNAPLDTQFAAPLVPVGKLGIPAKVERALLKSFDYIARDGKKGMKDFIKAIEALAKDPVALAKIVAFCALLAVPVVGEAAAGAFLAYAYYLLGFHGTLAALHFGAACVRAASATTDAEIDVAAREFADAFEDLGEAVIAWLMTRIQPMSSVGAQAGAAEKEAAIVAKAETQTAKVVKTEESYQTKVLSKYKEAKEEAKVAADAIVTRPIIVTERGVAITPDLLDVQGTSKLVGNFQGIQGATVEEIVSRVPKDWIVVPQEKGMGIRFLDDLGTERLRLHGPGVRAPAGSNSAVGWTARVHVPGVENQYYDSLGNIVGPRANEGHIPIFGNPSAGL